LGTYAAGAPFDRNSPIDAAAQMDAVPVTVRQLPYFFAAELDPRSRSNYVRVDLALAGPLNRPALENTLCAIVDHHESLRVRFGYDERGPIQTAVPLGATVPITHLRADGDPPWPQARKCIDTAEADAWLDLKKGPLFRFFLLQLSSTRHVLRWLVHHAVADGRSESIFVTDFARAYEALVRGLPSPLRPPRVRYTDWAIWDSRRRQEPSASEAYWRERFAKDDRTDGDHESVTPRAVEHTQRFNLAADIELNDNAALMGAAALADARISVLLFTALAMALTNAWRRTPLTIGVLNANRQHAELGDIIGQFADVVPVTLDVPGDDSTSALIRAVRRAFVEALRHSDVPFFQILQLAGCSEPFGTSGVCDVLFNMVDSAPRTSNVDDLTIARIDDDIGDVDPRLALYVGALHSAGGLRITMSGSHAAFALADLRQLLSHYVELFRDLVRAT